MRDCVSVEWLVPVRPSRPDQIPFEKYIPRKWLVPKLSFLHTQRVWWNRGPWGVITPHGLSVFMLSPHATLTAGAIIHDTTCARIDRARVAHSYNYTCRRTSSSASRREREGTLSSTTLDQETGARRAGAESCCLSTPVATTCLLLTSCSSHRLRLLYRLYTCRTWSCGARAEREDEGHSQLEGRRRCKSISLAVRLLPMTRLCIAAVSSTRVGLARRARWR